MLDLYPHEPLLHLKGHVQDALVEARGGEGLQHDGDREHVSLGYSYDTANGCPLQSALHKITPSQVPFQVSSASTSARARAPAGVGDLSWDPVAVIPLGAARHSRSLAEAKPRHHVSGAGHKEAITCRRAVVNETLRDMDSDAPYRLPPYCPDMNPDSASTSPPRPRRRRQKASTTGLMSAPGRADEWTLR